MLHASLQLIVRDRFKSVQPGEQHAAWSLWRVLVYGIVPLGAASVLAALLPPLPSKYQGSFFQIFAIVATVFTAALPIVQNFITNRQLKEKYTPAQRAQWSAEFTRLQVARQLYTAIAWAVVLLITSLLPVLLIQFESWADLARQIISALVYATSISVAFSFIEIVVDIYIILNDELKAIEAELKSKEPIEER